MSDAAYVLGAFAAALLPALPAVWLVRRRLGRGRAGTLLSVLLAFGVAWLGLGAFVSLALSGFAAPMD